MGNNVEVELHKKVIEYILGRAERTVSEKEIQSKFKDEDEIVLDSVIDRIDERDGNLKVDYQDYRLTKVISVKRPVEQFVTIMRGLYDYIVKQKKKYIIIKELFKEAEVQVLVKKLKDYKEQTGESFLLKDFIGFIDQMKYWFDVSVSKNQGNICVSRNDKYALSIMVMTEAEDEAYSKRKDEETIAELEQESDESLIDFLEEGVGKMEVGRKEVGSAKDKLKNQLNEWLRTTTLAEMDDEVYEISKEVKQIIKKLTKEKD